MQGDPRFDNRSPIEAPGSVAPAVSAGVLAAIIAGAAWAAIVWLTHYEIGYAAVGVGALVGFAMSRATPRRDRTVGVIAALLALSGLLAARVFIAEFVMSGQSAKAVLEDSEMMTQAAMMELASTSRFKPELQARFEAIPDDVELPEELLIQMKAEAEGYLQGIDDAERRRLAENFASVLIANVDMTNLLIAQMSPLDLLWVFLAVSTAWKMMSREAAVPPPVDPAPSVH